jgi:hypothetical protein
MSASATDTSTANEQLNHIVPPNATSNAKTGTELGHAENQQACVQLLDEAAVHLGISWAICVWLANVMSVSTI